MMDLHLSHETVGRLRSGGRCLGKLAGLVTLAALLACVFGGLAQAQSNRNGRDSRTMRTPEPTLEFGLSLTRTLTDVDGGSMGALPSTDNEKSGRSGIKFHGGLRLSSELSIEAQLGTVGRYRKDDATHGVDARRDVRIAGAAAVWALPAAKDLTLTAKAGLAHVRQHDHVTVGAVTTDDKQTRIKPFGGVGLKYRLTHDLTLRGEYELFSLPDKSRLHQFSIGMGYRF